MLQLFPCICTCICTCSDKVAHEKFMVGPDKPVVPGQLFQIHIIDWHTPGLCIIIPKVNQEFWYRLT